MPNRRIPCGATGTVHDVLCTTVTIRICCTTMFLLRNISCLALHAAFGATTAAKLAVCEMPPMCLPGGKHVPDQATGDAAVQHLTLVRAAAGDRVRLLDRMTPLVGGRRPLIAVLAVCLALPCLAWLLPCSKLRLCHVRHVLAVACMGLR